jgi:hypothetical protein
VQGAAQESLESPGPRSKWRSPGPGGSYLGFHRPLGVVPPPSPGRPFRRPSPSPLFYSTPYYSPSHFYPDKLYQPWPPPYSESPTAALTLLLRTPRESSLPAGPLVLLLSTTTRLLIVPVKCAPAASPMYSCPVPMFDVGGSLPRAETEGPRPGDRGSGTDSAVPRGGASTYSPQGRGQHYNPIRPARLSALANGPSDSLGGEFPHWGSCLKEL